MQVHTVEFKRQAAGQRFARMDRIEARRYRIHGSARAAAIALASLTYPAYSSRCVSIAFFATPSRSGKENFLTG